MTVAKRVEVVRLQLVRQSSFLYEPRRCSSPEAAYELFAPFVQDQPVEYLVVACLNNKNEVINVSTVSIGTVNQTIAIPREVIKVALLCNALSIIVCHNHVSNDVSPSEQDVIFTEKLKEACELVQLKLLDHLIIGFDGDYQSLKDLGLLGE